MSAAVSARERLLELLRQRSFERKRVVLASGKESHFFIDCKQTSLTAEGHALLGELMLDAIERLSGPVDAVAGVVVGGCPLASAVSLTSHLRGRGLPALYVRKERKDHGSAKRVEGALGLRPGARVALLEDVVTTGGSTLGAIEALREIGSEVAGVVAIVDRAEGGAEAIRAAGAPFAALFDRRDFLKDE
ncbi:MAG: orotate phosphoribosyltransferase [Deltaproteobacteria bacterium]|nr:orotate phosphoribosyltransferase [Deltaproteobacteria bacterium]